MEPDRPTDNVDDELRPKDDKPARRRSEEKDPTPQADGDSTDEGDAGVEDAAENARLK